MINTPNDNERFSDVGNEIGVHRKPAARLHAARRSHPDDVVIARFLALAQQSAGDPARALRTTPEAVLTTARAGRTNLTADAEGE